MKIIARNVKTEHTIDRTVFRRLGALLRNEIIACFNNSVDPYGKAWPPLSAKTIAKRRKSSSKPLIDTGTLLNSIQYQTTANSVIVGASTTAPYAPFHQYGTSRIPKRQFIPDADKLPNRWARLINSTIRNAVQISIHN